LKPLRRSPSFGRNGPTGAATPGRVGPITFGASIRDTRQALAEPLRALGRGWGVKVETFFKDARRDGLPVDDFFSLGLHIYYRVDGGRVVCYGVELSAPARPTYDELDLLVAPFAEVRSSLATRDPSHEGSQPAPSVTRRHQAGVKVLSCYTVRWAPQSRPPPEPSR
jgi:hypothetical protein